MPPKTITANLGATVLLDTDLQEPIWAIGAVEFARGPKAEIETNKIGIGSHQISVRGKSSGTEIVFQTDLRVKYVERPSSNVVNILSVSRMPDFVSASETTMAYKTLKGMAFEVRPDQSRSKVKPSLTPLKKSVTLATQKSSMVFIGRSGTEQILVSESSKTVITPDEAIMELKPLRGMVRMRMFDNPFDTVLKSTVKDSEIAWKLEPTIWRIRLGSELWIVMQSSDLIIEASKEKVTVFVLQGEIIRPGETPLTARTGQQLTWDIKKPSLEVTEWKRLDKAKVEGTSPHWFGRESIYGLGKAYDISAVDAKKIGSMVELGLYVPALEAVSVTKEPAETINLLHSHALLGLKLYDAADEKLASAEKKESAYWSFLNGVRLVGVDLCDQAIQAFDDSLDRGFKYKWIGEFYLGQCSLKLERYNSTRDHLTHSSWKDDGKQVELGFANDQEIRVERGELKKRLDLADTLRWEASLGGYYSSNPARLHSSQDPPEEAEDVSSYGFDLYLNGNWRLFAEDMISITAGGTIYKNFWYDSSYAFVEVLTIRQDSEVLFRIPLGQSTNEMNSIPPVAKVKFGASPYLDVTWIGSNRAMDRLGSKIFVGTEVIADLTFGIDSSVFIDPGPQADDGLDVVFDNSGGAVDRTGKNLAWYLEYRRSNNPGKNLLLSLSYEDMYFGSELAQPQGNTAWSVLARYNRQWTRWEMELEGNMKNYTFREDSTGASSLAAGGVVYWRWLPRLKLYGQGQFNSFSSEIENSGHDELRLGCGTAYSF